VGINTRLTDTLAWVRKLATKKISDEDASSGADSEGSEGTEDDRHRKI
jgi:hypothetical protein